MKVRCRIMAVAVAVLAIGTGSAWAQGAKSKAVTVTGRVVDSTCLYVLMAHKPLIDPNGQIREHFEGIVPITGDLYEAPGGQWILAITEVRAAKTK